MLGVKTRQAGVPYFGGATARTAAGRRADMACGIDLSQTWRVAPPVLAWRSTVTWARKSVAGARYPFGIK